MKIISKYILKEHIGPFTFALTALTSLLLLQYIARNFGDLVGKGLPWEVIAEFFVLSVPFTVAMTLPMAVLVAVLYAFTRLASENEVTALKAGGVSMTALMVPVFVASVGAAVFMVAFNDQVLPRANHQLAVLQLYIFRTKPTFALKEQVINTVKEGQLYLSAGKLDEGSARMRDVVIYDLSDPTRRRTIYAESGFLEFASNQRDLDMTLFHGVMQSQPTDKPEELTRLFYQRDRLRVPGVASGPTQHADNPDTVSKGDREMSVCEMQEQLMRYQAMLRRAENVRDSVEWAVKIQKGIKARKPALLPYSPRPRRTIGGLYCSIVVSLESLRAKLHVPSFLHVKEAHAARVPQDTSLRRFTQAKPPPAKSPPAPVPGQSTPPPGAAAAQAIPSGAAAVPPPVVGAAIPPSAGGGSSLDTRLLQAQMQIDDAQRLRNRYAIEIHKKFSLAATCIIFVLVGAPVALRFPSGGVGLVIGVSFFIFALYYVGLIGGEELANRSIISPFWAMWGANVLLAAIGVVLASRMGRETATSRGGDMRELLQVVRGWFSRQGRRVGLKLDRRTA